MRIREEIYESNRPEFFDREFAKRHGIPMAIVIHFLDNVLQSSACTPDKKSADRTRWFTASAEFIRNRLPFLTRTQIHDALLTARNLGFVRAEATSGGTHVVDTTGFGGTGCGGGRLGLRYTLNLPRLRTDGWTRKNAQSRKYESMSIRPRDARDHGLHAACVIHELEQIQYELVSSDQQGWVPARMPTLNQLTARLPMSRRQVSKVLAELRINQVLTEVPASPAAGIRPLVLDRLDVAERPDRPTPVWDRPEPTQAEREAAIASHESAVDELLASPVDASTDDAFNPDWRAHALADALRHATKVGVIDPRTMRVVSIRTVCDPADELAARAVFAANPECTPKDIMRVIEACAGLSLEQRNPGAGEWDPIWHSRIASRSLRHLFLNWQPVHENLASHGRECRPPALRIMPSPDTLYPHAAARRKKKEK